MNFSLLTIDVDLFLQIRQKIQIKFTARGLWTLTLVIVLIINAVAIFCLGAYYILTKIVFRIKPSEKKN